MLNARRTGAVLIHAAALSFVAALVVAPFAHGDVIASFDFAGGSASSSDTESNTTVTDTTFGAGISGAAFINDQLEIGGDDTTTAIDSGNFNTTVGEAIANDDYMTFTLTIPAGVEVDLDALEFDYEIDNGFEFGMGVFSDATGFTLGDELYSIFDNSTGNQDLDGELIDLSANSAFQDLTGTTLEFRFYTGDFSASATRIHAFDNIILSGTVTGPPAIPEPSSLVLWAILSFVGQRIVIRRRRRAA